jgi:hypothetical protein
MYHPLADGRRREADSIVDTLINSVSPERMTKKEARLVAEMIDRKTSVSVKQLSRLRDIKNRYL